MLCGTVKGVNVNSREVENGGVYGALWWGPTREMWLVVMVVKESSVVVRVVGGRGERFGGGEKQCY